MRPWGLSEFYQAYGSVPGMEGLWLLFPAVPLFRPCLCFSMDFLSDPVSGHIQTQVGRRKEPSLHKSRVVLAEPVPQICHDTQICVLSPPKLSGSQHEPSGLHDACSPDSHR